MDMLTWTTIAHFELHRSRIPSTLFEAIAEDMHLTLMQYGVTLCHSTEEASAQFIAPVRFHYSLDCRGRPALIISYLSKYRS